jgi:glycosyltransferase involved in cell wall biosynthesis
MKNFYILIIIFLQIGFSFSFIKLSGEMEQNVINAVTYILSSSKPEIPKIDLNQKPKISIIIPVYNEEKYIKNVLKSIQLQTIKEIEIIFIDDKSTDKSVKKILEYKKIDKRIRLIKNQKNRGILYNRIYGGLQAKGDYVTFIDADDLYANHQILEMSYQACIQNELDLVEFDYFGGRFDIDKLEFKDVFLFTNQNKNLYDKVYYQPEIKKRFFYQYGTEDILAGIVYNKLYSHKLIERMADYIGIDFWNQHFIYMEDFLIVFAAARNAKSVMLLGYGGVFHWYENPEGMTKGVFDMDGKELKYPDNSNKKLGDYLSMWEKTFDLTEDESDSEYLRLKLIHLLKDPDNRHVFAQTYHYERIIQICKRMYNWKYSSDFAKNMAKEFALETIKLEIPIKKKYKEFFLDEYSEDDEEKKEKKKKKEKNTKKKQKKKKEEVSENEKLKKVKKEEKKIKDDTEELDGFLDDGLEDL